MYVIAGIGNETAPKKALSLLMMIMMGSAPANDLTTGRSNIAVRHHDSRTCKSAWPPRFGMRIFFCSGSTCQNHRPTRGLRGAGAAASYTKTVCAYPARRTSHVGVNFPQITRIFMTRALMGSWRVMLRARGEKGEGEGTQAKPPLPTFFLCASSFPRLFLPSALILGTRTLVQSYCLSYGSSVPPNLRHVIGFFPDGSQVRLLGCCPSVLNRTDIAPRERAIFRFYEFCVAVHS